MKAVTYLAAATASCTLQAGRSPATFTQEILRSAEAGDVSWLTCAEWTPAQTCKICETLRSWLQVAALTNLNSPEHEVLQHD